MAGARHVRKDAEAPVHEYDFLAPRQNDVGLSRKVGLVHAEAVAHCA